MNCVNIRMHGATMKKTCMTSFKLHVFVMTVDGYFEFMCDIFQLLDISTCKYIKGRCRGNYTVFLKIGALILTRTPCYEYLTLDRMLYLLTKISSKMYHRILKNCYCIQSSFSQKCLLADPLWLLK